MSGKVTLKDIITIFGVNERTVYRRLKQFGIEPSFEAGSCVAYYPRQEIYEAFGMPLYAEDETDWNRANCKGINTDLFYTDDTDLGHRQLEKKELRKICFHCPIRMACLKNGFAKERWGMWGGVTEKERKQILDKKFLSDEVRVLRRDLEEFGVDFAEILEASQVERNWHL